MTVDLVDDTRVIHPMQRWLSDEVPLSVHLVTGSHFAVLVDTGVAEMFEEIGELIAETLARPSDLKLIVNTHAHHDHIGCNTRLSELSGALVAATAVHADWHSDLDLHYREFALEHPELVPDTPQLRAEVLDTIDGPRGVDLLVDEGLVLDLGGGVVLETVALPGHMPGELGVVEHLTRTLILGDALTGVDWSFFHGYSDVDVYLATLTRLRALIVDRDIQRVRPAHYDWMTGPEALEAVDAVVRGIESVDLHVRGAVRAKGSCTLGQVWFDVSKAMGKAADFRGLRLVEAHLDRLGVAGAVDRAADGSYRWASP